MFSKLYRFTSENLIIYDIGNKVLYNFHYTKHDLAGLDFLILSLFFKPRHRYVRIFIKLIKMLIKIFKSTLVKSITDYDFNKM